MHLTTEGREPGAMTQSLWARDSRYWASESQVSALSRPLTQHAAWGLKCMSVEWRDTSHCGQ